MKEVNIDNVACVCISDFVMGKISKEDLILIKNLRLHKLYGARRLMNEFPQKGWSKGGLDKVLHKIDTTGSVERAAGSGRQRFVRTPANIETVAQLIESDSDNEDTRHRSPRQIAHEMGISRSSVRRIIKCDLNLKVYTRVKVHQLSEGDCERRKNRCEELLVRFSQRNVHHIWFSDEKCFSISPALSKHNDIYIRVMTF